MVECPLGGTSRLVTGLVFKTSRAAARVVAGGFDSHVPPLFHADCKDLRTAESWWQRMKRWLKAELHTHTREDPIDGRRIVLHSPKELIDAAAAQGFEVLSITNHNQLLFEEGISKYAHEKGILLLPGVEATLEGSHTLLHNFLDYDPSWITSAQVMAKKGPDQMVIAAHPFFPIRSALGRRFLAWRELFDAVEYNHFYTKRINFNLRAQNVARQCRLPLIGNSDVHFLEQLGCSYSLVYAEKETVSVVDAIKRGSTRIVTSPLGASFTARVLFAVLRGNLRISLRKFGALFPDSTWSGGRGATGPETGR